MKKLDEIEVSAKKPLHEKAIDSFNHYMGSKNIMTRFFAKLFTKMFILICLLLGMLYTSGTFDIVKFIKGK
jgi:preprotein translocase subunit SecG